MHFTCAARTDVGIVRSGNEDNYLMLSDRGIFIVADGMGGHAAGEVASRTAADTITAKLQELLADDDLTPFRDANGKPCVGARRLVIAVECANDAIFRTAASNPSQRGMGTTVAALHFADGFANLCHVGDSRIYRIRNGEDFRGACAELIALANERGGRDNSTALVVGVR